MRKNLKSAFDDVVSQHFSVLSSLDALLHRHIDFIKEHGAVPQVLFSEEIIGDSKRRRRMLADIIYEHVSRVAWLVRKGQEDGEIRQDIDAEAVAIMFLGIVQPSAILWRASEGEFDFTGYARQAWRMFKECITMHKGARG